MSAFVPSFSLISNISNAIQAQVTFTAPHNFIIGENVSFRVSKPYGMVEMNNQIKTVIALSSTTITVALDSRNFTPFIFPAVGTVEALAMAVPSSSGVVPGGIPPQTQLLDAFDNVPNT